MQSRLRSFFPVPKPQGRQAVAQGTTALYKYLREKPALILAGAWLSSRLGPRPPLLLGWDPGRPACFKLRHAACLPPSQHLAFESESLQAAEQG